MQFRCRDRRSGAIEQGKVGDDDFAMLKRLMEKRDHDAMHATVAAVDTARYRSLRSMTPEIPSDVCVHVEKKEAGMMDPEQDQLESPSVGMVLKHPDHSVPRTGRHGIQNEPSLTAILLVDMGSN